MIHVLVLLVDVMNSLRLISILLQTDMVKFHLSFMLRLNGGDVQNLHAVHDLHTFTLQSPMVSNVKMTKSFFKVPMQAIYPRNWEKMMTIPTQGDDVPSDTRALLNISKLLDNCFYNLVTAEDARLIRYRFVLCELIASDGSLFNRFNLHFNFQFYDGSSGSIVPRKFDYFSDLFYTKLLEVVSNSPTSAMFISDGVTYILETEDAPRLYGDSYVFVSPRRFIELFRDASFDLNDYEEWYTVLSDVISYFSFSDYTITGYSSLPLSGEESNSRFINIEPIIAYQLSCAQFATNDFVDYIYSAQLYRENMQSLLTAIAEVPQFLYNGVRFQYDIFSQNVFDFLISEYNDTNSLEFFINLFSYNKSLRFGDYFTGAKPRPLAVGEYSAEVNNNQVSAIDITRSIQMQRLLNRVNMVGRKLSDYLSGIFGGSLPPAPKDVPIFLAHQRYDLKGFEVNNTGDVQFDVNKPNTITSQLRSADNKHIFEIEIDEPCYIIGVNSYECPRIYSVTIDRFAFHHDRYDDFIPQMQYIGDQAILSSEIDSSSNRSIPFAYTLRYMEYKLRYSYASGGFISNLPSWAFITDNKDGNVPSYIIGPDYIRSSPSEFDRFYKSLTSYSLGGYFHFIVAHTNVTSPSRMMEYTPEILK